MKKSLVGVIVSKKMDKTVVVEVSQWKTNRLFHKRYQQRRRFMVHNPDNAYEVGTSVEISPIRPLSRHKSWKIVGETAAKKKAGGQR